MGTFSNLDQDLPPDFLMTGRFRWVRTREQERVWTMASKIKKALQKALSKAVTTKKAPKKAEQMVSAQYHLLGLLQNLRRRRRCIRWFLSGLRAWLYERHG
jgi:hypothetical protein